MIHGSKDPERFRSRYTYSGRSRHSRTPILFLRNLCSTRSGGRQYSFISHSAPSNLLPACANASRCSQISASERGTIFTSDPPHPAIWICLRSHHSYAPWNASISRLRSSSFRGLNFETFRYYRGTSTIASKSSTAASDYPSSAWYSSKARPAHGRDPHLPPC